MHIYERYKRNLKNQSRYQDLNFSSRELDRKSKWLNCSERNKTRLKTIAVINQKGGVGKSTTSLAIGAGFILKGYKVLYIDLDAQGNLSYTLKASNNGYNVMKVLQNPETIRGEIKTTSQGDIIASSPALSGADSLLIETGKEYRLKESLEFISNLYDYVIIDTPPSLGILTINALTASDGILVLLYGYLFFTGDYATERNYRHSKKIL